MCLLTIATGACRRFPIIILNNRDEYVTRSTSKLTLFGANGVPLPPTSSPTSPSSSSSPQAFPIASSPSSSATSSNKLAHLLCAIDTSIPNGGTWMGVNVQTGAFASVTNSPQCASQVLHLPSLAPNNRIELTAASSSFDWAGYVAKVIGASSLSNTTPTTTDTQVNGTDDSESGCCGLRVTNGEKNNAGISFARPFLKFAPEKSRGFIVGEYLSESRWESSDSDSRVPHDGSTQHGCRWLPCIPSNVVVPQKLTELRGEKSSAHVLDRDLYYEGYNLVCGNLIEIAESFKAQTREKAENAGVGGNGHFLYTTNRQHPFPLNRRGLEGDRRKAPAYSASWCSQDESPQSMLDTENCNVLRQQPSMYLGGSRAENNGRRQLSVNTVGNTFIDNPIEPKSKHLTLSVRSALERLFPLSTSDANSSSESNSSDFVSETLVPTLAECLCERPQLEIDLSEPAGKHLGLLAIKPMAGLSEEEYVDALRDRLSKRLGELATQQASKLSALASNTNDGGALGYDVGNLVSTLSDPERKKVVLDALLADISSSRESMLSRVAEEEREVHRNVYTHHCRDAVIAGTFKTRTQTIAILEDLEGTDTAGEQSSGARRYRLHYYLRDTNTHEDHAPWQVRVVDLPDLLAIANQTLT